MTIALGEAFMITNALRASCLAAAALLVLAACVPGPPLNETAAFSGGDESFFVIGAEPDHVDVFITRGDVENGHYAPDGWAKPAYASFPESGYIVGKARGTDVYGINTIFYKASRTAFLTSQFMPCGDDRTLTFRAKPGTVVYFTHMDIDLTSNGLVPRYHDDFAAAQAFLKAHYPLIADRLEHGEYKLMPVPWQCPH
jgi:hypothetical protein